VTQTLMKGDQHWGEISSTLAMVEVVLQVQVSLKRSDSQQSIIAGLSEHSQTVLQDAEVLVTSAYL